MAREDHPDIAREARSASGSERVAVPAGRCPDCRGEPCTKCGSRVPSLTLTSLLTEEARVRLSNPEGFRFCGSATCDTVYWKPETGERFAKKDLRVRVGLKERTPPQPVCYCFGFSIQDIEAQVSETGTSTIPDEITEKVRRKLCHCDDANPQGTCCLGNVQAALKAAQKKENGSDDPAAASIASAARPAHSCCVVQAESAASSPTSQTSCAFEAAPVRPGSSAEDAASRAPLLSSIGAVLSAILASACCWLPLVLIAFGASAASVSGFFERYRLAFLGAAAALLGLGIYFVYFRKEACGPDAVCPAPNPRLKRFNEVVLWIATALVVMAGAFPSYVGMFLGRGGRAPAASPDELCEPAHYAIRGMSCESCAATIRAELEKLPGVARAEVSFEAKEAAIVAARGSPLPSDAAVAEAIRRAGYESERISRWTQDGSELGHGGSMSRKIGLPLLTGVDALDLTAEQKTKPHETISGGGRKPPAAPRATTRHPERGR